MRRPRPVRAALVAAALELALGLAALAGAQPPQGIVRPTDEGGLSQLQLGAQLYAVLNYFYIMLNSLFTNRFVNML